MSTIFSRGMVSFLSLITFHCAFAHNADTPSKSARERLGTYVVVKPPVLLGAGLDIGRYSSSNIAYGMTADVDSYIVLATAFAGPYVRFFSGNSFYFQAALGANKNSLDAHYLGAELNAKIGNEWLFDSGLVLGGEWIGINIQRKLKGSETFDNVMSYQTFPKLRIGYAW